MIFVSIECPEFTYGLNCSEKCRCLANENCNHTNGECKRCKENPPATKCDEETSSETPETRTGFHLLSDGLFCMTKVKEY